MPLREGSALKVPVSVLVSIASGGNKDTRINLEVVDEVSRCVICNVEMSLEEWAKADHSMTGYGTAEIFRNAPLGKKRENKTVFVPYGAPSNSHTHTKGEAAQKLLEPFEVDGWKGRAKDLSNSHMWRRDEQGNAGALVSFSRYIDVEEDNG